MEPHKLCSESNFVRAISGQVTQCLSLELLLTMRIIVFSALRVLAVTGGNWAIFLSVLLLSLVPIITNLVSGNDSNQSQHSSFIYFESF